MDTIKTIYTKWETLINNYIELLIKSESLHDKLERLFKKALTNPSLQLKNQIVKVNNALNKALVEQVDYISAINFCSENIA